MPYIESSYLTDSYLTLTYFRTREASAYAIYILLLRERERIESKESSIMEYKQEPNTRIENWKLETVINHLILIKCLLGIMILVYYSRLPDIVKFT